MDGIDFETVRYVSMPGSPYTGSTLLGFLLNTHPDCVSIGAATGLTRRVDIETYQCSCGRPFLECEFWRQVEKRTLELGHPVTVYQSDFWNTHLRLSRRRWLNGLLVRSLGSESLTDWRDRLLAGVGPINRALEETRSSTWALARSVLDLTGKSVFVDTARDHQRPKYLQPHPGLDLKVIHLIRDPRGTVSSIVGHTGVDVAKAARQWRHYNVEADRVRRYVPDDSWLRVHYEDLCADPQGTLDEIAKFIGVTPAPLPEPLDSVDNHVIGNSMRLQGVREIRLDEKWRERLDSTALDEIARITHEDSHRFGYDWP
jgi:hypothetical protein